jgi:hypothetical protein
VAQDGAWQFEFGTERDEVFSDGSSDLGSLLRDCEHVPMLTNLNEVVELPGQLVTQGADQNIWFEIIS